mgnify:FL=1
MRSLLAQTLFLLLIGLGMSGLSAAPPAEDSKGKDINGVCAACHGEFGQGGKRGEYPRVAGQRAAYRKDQLKSIRAR